MKFIISILSVLFSFICFSQSCGLLPNGKYSVIYDDKYINHPKFTFKIKDDKLYSKDLTTGKTTKFKINQSDFCTFRIRRIKSFVSDPNATEFGNIINNMENDYYKFEKISDKEYKFVYKTFPPDALISSGKFIKKVKNFR